MEMKMTHSALARHGRINIEVMYNEEGEAVHYIVSTSNEKTVFDTYEEATTHYLNLQKV